MRKRAFICLFVLASLFESGAAIVVLRCEGEVTASEHWSKPTRKLRAGRAEWTQMLVLTGKKGFADLKLEDGSLVRVKENSIVSVDVTKHDQSVLYLKKGTAICVARRSYPESKFEVQLSVGVCGTTGERVEFAVDEHGKVESVFGKVVPVWIYSGPAHPLTVLEPGEMTTPRAQWPNFKMRMTEERLEELKGEIKALKDSEAKWKNPPKARKRAKGF